MSTDWLVSPRANPTAAVRLFCVPPSGAGSSAYRGWAENLDRRVDVRYVQLPGRENRFREPPFTALDRLVAALSTELSGLLDRPYAFYGHSFGAIIAFETIRELRKRGFAEPEHLFVSASRAPHLPWMHSPVRHLEGSSLLREVHRRYQSVPREFLDDAEIHDLVVPALRADLTMVETYSYAHEPPLECGITAVGGNHDQMVDATALALWGNHSDAEFVVHMLDDGHMFLQTKRARLLEIVSKALGRRAQIELATGVGRTSDG